MKVWGPSQNRTHHPWISNQTCQRLPSGAEQTAMCSFPCITCISANSSIHRQQLKMTIWASKQGYSTYRTLEQQMLTREVSPKPLPLVCTKYGRRARLRLITRPLALFKGDCEYEISTVVARTLKNLHTPKGVY